MVDVPNNLQNSYYQRLNHIALPKNEVTSSFILSAGVQRAAGLGKSIRSLVSRSLSDLFNNGETGVLFDPSTTGTLYTTTAMTIPATPGDPVGMMLDQSQWGGVALGTGTVAETLAPIMGPELVTNGTFDGDIAGWTNNSSGVGEVSYDAGTILVETITDYNNRAQAYTIVPVTAGSVYKVSGTLTGGTGAVTQNGLFVGVSPANNSNLASGEYSGGIGSTVTHFVTAPAGITQVYVTLRAPFGAGTGNFDNITVKKIPGHHATQATAAKRPTYQTDGTLHWLAFDGVDDAMATPSINFTATDKMSVFTGLRKLSDAVGYGLVCELSTATGTSLPGSFGWFAPSAGGTGSYYTIVAQSSGSSFDMFTYAAPITNVFTLQLDFGGATRLAALKARVDGAIPVIYGGSDAAPGVGNFGNYPLYIGARAGTSLYFNGNLYGLTVRGASSVAAEVAEAEAITAELAGITL
tara:strand:- start:2905 stop:4302 length:1398 start_codon:yes stop_codon:yes gene_type:complete